LTLETLEWYSTSRAVVPGALTARGPCGVSPEWKGSQGMRPAGLRAWFSC